MTVFVLVHGAWGGGWQWRDVARHLREAGHEAFTPTLTGLGEREHLLSPEIDLETHIQDVVGVIRWERLEAVALVGHGYAGMVVSGVADRLAESVGALIYLDAVIPEDGEAMLDLVPPERRALIERLSEEEGYGYTAPDSLLPETGIEDTAVHEAFIARTSDHPLAALIQPIRLHGGYLKVPRKGFLRCRRSQAPQFRHSAEWAAGQPDWRVETLGTGHFPMATMPRETAEALAAMAAG